MPDSTSFQQVLTRSAGDVALKAALRRQGSSAGKGARAAIWTALLLLAALTVAPIAYYARQAADSWRLLETRAIPPAAAQPAAPSVDYLEALSELSTDNDIALAAARRAVEAEPSRAFVWARIAWLEASKAGKVAAPSLEALTRSMDACPLCDEELVRWRFNFVLANWGAVPEAVRSRAFEHADLLGWSGENSEFLAEMRIKAELAGIPYTAYRSAVKSPVRSWDIAPASDAVTTSVPASPGG